MTAESSYELGLYRAGSDGIRRLSSSELRRLPLRASRPKRRIKAPPWITRTQEEQSMKQPDRLLTPGEVAGMFRVDPKTVTRWAAAGLINSIRTPGGHRRFWESEVRALLEQPTRGMKPPPPPPKEDDGDV